MLPQEEIIGVDSLFAEGNDIGQLKREYIENHRRKLSSQRKRNTRK
ncbi:MAG: hypothetical protein ACFKPT_11105 [Gloeotrichia echinulata GP01]